MKLKNKISGEIKEFSLFDGNELQGVATLESLTKEWEEYEGPKGIQCIYYVNHFDAARLNGVIVGFETKEEAKKAVEKLKAWKRLKDKGFRFAGWNRRYCDEINYKLDTTEDMSKDLDLLFGGEE